jgi:hypothetical protein
MRFRDQDKQRLGQARLNRVPVPAAAAQEERPNQVMRARVGERAAEPEPEAAEPQAP